MIFLRFKGIALIRSKPNLEHLIVLLFLGYFGLHVIFWTFGMGASAGLIRLMAPITPLLVLIAAKGFDILRMRSALSMLSQRFLFAFIIIQPLFFLDFLNNDIGALSEKAVNYVEEQESKGIVYCSRPEFLLGFGADPWAESNYKNTVSMDSLDKIMRPGDLLLWDSQIAQNDGKLFYYALKSHPQFIEKVSWQDDNPEIIQRYGPEEDWPFMLDSMRISVFERLE